MGATLVLKDVLARLGELDAHLVVYVPSGSEPTGETEVFLVDYHGPRTPRPAGMRYLLGVGDMRDVLATWSEWRAGRVPTEDERVEAVLFYAESDGYLPV